MKPTERDPSSSQSLLIKLSQSVTQGLALASLTVASSCAESEPARHEGARDSGDDSAPSGPMAEVEPLQPYALDQLGCWNSMMGQGYFGPCCVEAHCYTPDDGAACVTEPLVTALRGLVPFPSGSGSCSCTLPDSELAAAGPFAPNPDAEPSTDGECCYLVAKIGCTGRPLMVAGQPVIAALVSRTDWAPFA
jgi:hypothetical protein